MMPPVAKPMKAFVASVSENQALLGWPLLPAALTIQLRIKNDPRTDTK
jgi:hypothetical protein